MEAGQALEALVAAVAALGELVAATTAPRWDATLLVAKGTLRAALRRFTRHLRHALDHGDVTCPGHRGVTPWWRHGNNHDNDDDDDDEDEDSRRFVTSRNCRWWSDDIAPLDGHRRLWWHGDGDVASLGRRGVFRWRSGDVAGARRRCGVFSWWREDVASLEGHSVIRWRSEDVTSPPGRGDDVTSPPGRGVVGSRSGDVTSPDPRGAIPRWPHGDVTSLEPWWHDPDDDVTPPGLQGVIPWWPDAGRSRHLLALIPRWPHGVTPGDLLDAIPRWRCHLVTSLGQRGVPSLGQALPALLAHPDAPWARDYVTSVAGAWLASVETLTEGWERLSREATELRDAWEAAAARRRLPAAAALALLARLTAACFGAAEFPRELRRRLGDIQAGLEGRREAAGEGLEEEVAAAERLWAASARLAQRHLLGTLGDIGALLKDGPAGGPRDLRVAERCREAVGDIPRLLQG